jgi:hypothetical protein
MLANDQQLASEFTFFPGKKSSIVSTAQKFQYLQLLQCHECLKYFIISKNNLLDSTKNIVVFSLAKS